MTHSPAEAGVVVVGASSQIGAALIAQLAAAGHSVVKVSREPAATGCSDRQHVYDAASGTFAPALDGAHAVISLAPLPHAGTVVRMAEQLGARRVLAFGSSSVFTKGASTAAIEREFVRDQRAAEEQLRDTCSRAGVHWTLFRPTMIYGAGADLNVEFIRVVSRRLHCFPLPIGAAGRRQPVHVDDLAAACVAALACPATHDRAYNLGGGEVLGYAEMVRRIAAADGRRCPLVRLPSWLYRALVQAAARRPRLAYLRAEMVDRMFEDLIVDNAPAQTDFGYHPRLFRPGPQAGRSVRGA